jgi:hypothetical protein
MRNQPTRWTQKQAMDFFVCMRLAEGLGECFCLVTVKRLTRAGCSDFLRPLVPSAHRVRSGLCDLNRRQNWRPQLGTERNLLRTVETRKLGNTA